MANVAIRHNMTIGVRGGLEDNRSLTTDLQHPLPLNLDGLHLTLGLRIALVLISS